MSDSYADSEKRLAKAIEDINDGVFPSASAAAQHYNLKARRVQYRLKGMASRSTRPATYQRLTIA